MSRQSPTNPALAWLERITSEQRLTLYRLLMRAAELGAQVADTNSNMEGHEPKLDSQANASEPQEVLG